MVTLGKEDQAKRKHGYANFVEMLVPCSLLILPQTHRRHGQPVQSM